MSRIVTALALSLAVFVTVHGKQDAVRVQVSNPATNLKMIPTGAGHISGQTIDAGSGKPIAGVIVTVSLAGFVPSRVMSDGDGRFTFPALPKGRFNLTGTLAGYSSGASGRLRPSGPSAPVELNDGERVADVVITLWKLASIGGIVTDDRGDPIVGAVVQSYRRSLVAGRWQLTSGASDATDDRGVYRISGLEPGEWAVGLQMTFHSWPASLENYMLLGAEWPQELMASTLPVVHDLIGVGVQLAPGFPVVAQTTSRVAPAGVSADGHVIGYETQFFSGAGSAADATPIKLESGDERLGVDFALRTTPLRNVSGVVTSATGPVGDLGVVLIPSSAPSSAAVFVAATSVTDGRGRFTFVGVPPGQYRLRAVKPPKGEPGARGEAFLWDGDTATPSSVQPLLAVPRDPLLWDEQTVGVDTTDVTGVTLTLAPAARVRGRVEFTGTTAAPAGNVLNLIAISLALADGGTDAIASGRGRVESSLQFGTMGVPAGKYVLQVAGVPAGWMLKSATLGGRDLSQEPFDLGDADLTGVVITFTDRVTALTGSVASPAGGADTTATVVAFPTNSAEWTGRGPEPRRLRSTRVDRSGAYTLTALPAGQYFVAAIPEAASKDWQDPAMLAILARTAAKIDIAAGESKSLSLQTTRISGR